MNPNAEYIFGDLEGAEVVFHLAAAVGVGESMYQIEKYVEVNTYATAKLLDILMNEENDVKKLIVASSIYRGCEVYLKIRREEQLKRREWEMRYVRRNWKGER
ncbi:MAG: NAD-dependent epimerase/dehydratase family protein [Candidatus Methanospirareceae archaeon]